MAVQLETDPQTTCAFAELYPSWQPTSTSATLPPQADAIQLHHPSCSGEATVCCWRLSLCPRKLPHAFNTITQQETVESYITVIIMQLPASEECLKAYRAAQLQDPLCSKVTEFWDGQTSNGYSPSWNSIWRHVDVSLYKDLFLHWNRIVTPKKQQMETLAKLHQGHQGIQRCCLQPATSVWWPGMWRNL